jgi:hypothetical protein
MRIAFAICLCLLLVSCKRKSHPEYAKQILGEWKLVTMADRPTDHNKPLQAPPSRQMPICSGFNFINESICENKDLSSKTHYELNDSLRIWNLFNKKWESIKIARIKADTLVLDNSYLYLVYVRKNYKIDAGFTFDEVILSSYSTWGLGNEIIMNKNRTIIYCEHLTKRDNYTREKINKNNKGELVREENGFGVYRTHQNRQDLYFAGKVSNEKLKELTNNFQKADITKLNTEYHSGGADGSEVALTFIKDGKIIKTIHDYMESSPAELRWAYKPLQYLNQQIKLDTATSSPFQFSFRELGFTIGKKGADLKLSESAYLLNLLRTANVVNMPFNKKYLLVFYDFGKSSKIQTDGQYYEITYKNGTKKTYDIGFNFIERNASVLKFKNKANID